MADRVIEDVAIARQITGVEHVRGLAGLDGRTRARRDGRDLDAVSQRGVDGATVKALLALLFENAPPGMNWALMVCLPKKYELPPGWGVRV